MSKAKLMVVDDEESIRHFLSLMLKKQGFEVKTAKSASEALSFLEENEIDLAICDLKMPKMDGIALLKEIKKYSPETIVIMITAYATTKTAVQALKAGAYDYITKPFDIEELTLIIEKALEKKRLEEENIYLRRELIEKYRFGNLVGKSKKMIELYRVIEQVAPTNSTVLITGARGTGKELVAKAIHYNSPRREFPFVSINCAALSEELLESELFGHMKGAFTSAFSDKKGLFEVADKGTILLDEISEMPLRMQAKLLRVLQEKTIRRVGGTKEIKVDVRVIASTNKDLRKLVSSGSFRDDLFDRINVIEIKLPLLRERKEDILLLADHFLAKFNKETGKNIKGFTPEVKELLLRYHWPGNVRELENAIERAVALETGEYIVPERLPEQIRRETEFPKEGIVLPEGGIDLEKHLTEIRKEFMSLALAKTGGVQKKAAELLGMSFRSFRYFVKKYNLNQR